MLLPHRWRRWCFRSHAGCLCSTHGPRKKASSTNSQSHIRILTRAHWRQPDSRSPLQRMQPHDHVHQPQPQQPTPHSRKQRHSQSGPQMQGSGSTGQWIDELSCDCPTSDLGRVSGRLQPTIEVWAAEFGNDRRDTCTCKLFTFTFTFTCVNWDTRPADTLVLQTV